MKTLNELLEKPITCYAQAEQFLYALPRFTEKTALSHTKELLSRLDAWETDIPRIHVAGTNGKGSVCAYLQGLFKEYGMRVGCFISPHLVRMHERFLIDQKPVSDALFLESFFSVYATVKEAYLENIAYPTFFEFLFLMGMLIFKKSGVELVILETGLGGRLDATNVFDTTELCVLTAIGLDHCQYLGSTIEEIAAEKAGIIKKGTHVVYIDRKDESSKVFREFIKKKAAFDCSIRQNEYSVEKIKHKGIDFSYKSSYYNYISLTMSTNALYQTENASLALRAFETYIKMQGLKPMPQKKLQHAIVSVFWEGRMEEVRPGIFFDGAHNVNGICAFLESVRTMDCFGKRILCFSVAEDKDYARMIRLLCESRLFSSAVAVEMEEARGASLAVLKENFSQFKYMDLYCERGAKEGLKRCISQKENKDQIFIVGSLYLVGLIKAVLTEEIQ